jgi:hypothetical protein
MITSLKLCRQGLFQANPSKWTTSVLPRYVNKFTAVSVVALRTYSQKGGKNLDYYREQPVLGNLNSNPYEHQMALKGRWPRNDNSRRLNVAVLGIPNSGKSTLINKAHALSGNEPVLRSWPFLCGSGPSLMQKILSSSSEHFL